jgi:hypothetical protein
MPSCSISFFHRPCIGVFSGAALARSLPLALELSAAPSSSFGVPDRRPWETIFSASASGSALDSKPRVASGNFSAA